MDEGTSALRKIEELTNDPGARAGYAATLVEKAKDPQAVTAAVKVLGESGDERYRRVLLGRYERCDARGPRRDPGGTIRAAILQALRPISLPEDVPLLEHAVTTYEFLYGEEAGDLRAAGLLALNDLDGELAGYHAVRLLNDHEYTWKTSGEPAVTAVRVLASQDQLLPVYAYALRDGEYVSDVLAECLRHLVRLPRTLLARLVERYGESEDEIVLLGLFDLLLEHEARDEYRDFLFDFLRRTNLYNIYRYLVMTLITSHEEGLAEGVRALERTERDSGKQAILREALALR